MSKRDSKKPGSLTLGLKEIKMQTGDLEDGHKDIKSSMTHLQPGPGLLGRSQLWAVAWPRGGPSSNGTRPLQGQVKLVFSSGVVCISLCPHRCSLRG